MVAAAAEAVVVTVAVAVLAAAVAVVREEAVAGHWRPGTRHPSFPRWLLSPYFLSFARCCRCRRL